MNFELINPLFSIPYIFLCILGLVLVPFEKKNSGSWVSAPLLFYLIVLTVFFGFRGYIYTDWISYYQIYQEVPSIFENNIFEFLYEGPYKQIEPLFLVYVSISKSVFDNYNGWIVFNSLIDLLILTKFFKIYLNKSVILGLVFFLVFSGFELEINLMRNIKSILLFLISIKYLETKKITKFILLNIIGVFFHTSSILYLMIFPLLLIRPNKKIIITFFILGNLVFLLQLSYISPILLQVSHFFGGKIYSLVSIYLSSQQTSAPYGITIGYIERTITFLLVFFIEKPLLEKRNSLDIFYNSLLIYLFIYLFFSEVSIIVLRLPILFAFSYWVIYPNMISAIKKRSVKVIVYFIFAVYLSLKMISGNATYLSKYENILSGENTYKERKFIFKTYSDILLNKDH